MKGGWEASTMRWRDFRGSCAVTYTRMLTRSTDSRSLLWKYVVVKSRQDRKLSVLKYLWSSRGRSSSFSQKVNEFLVSLLYQHFNGSVTSARTRLEFWANSSVLNGVCPRLLKVNKSLFCCGNFWWTHLVNLFEIFFFQTTEMANADLEKYYKALDG